MTRGCDRHTPHDRRSVQSLPPRDQKIKMVRSSSVHSPLRWKERGRQSGGISHQGPLRDLWGGGAVCTCMCVHTHVRAYARGGRACTADKSQVRPRLLARGQSSSPGPSELAHPPTGPGTRGAHMGRLPGGFTWHKQAENPSLKKDGLRPSWGPGPLQYQGLAARTWLPLAVLSPLYTS